ncbi:hypothetical protein IWW52_006274, partial [Coemansia sp. RSA 2704]
MYLKEIRSYKPDAKAAKADVTTKEFAAPKVPEPPKNDINLDADMKAYEQTGAISHTITQRTIAALLSSMESKIANCLLRSAATLAGLETSYLARIGTQQELEAAYAKLESLEQALQAAQIKRDAANIDAELLGAEGAELESECAAIFAKRNDLRAMSKTINAERDNA